MSLKPLAHLIRFFKALRGSLVALVFTVIGIPLLVVGIMSTDWAQNKLRVIANNELSKLLGTEVNIEHASVRTLNRIRLSDITVADDNGAAALSVGRIEARYEFWDLLLSGKIIVDYATVDGMDVRLYRDSIGAPLNIQNIIQHLSSRPSDTQSVFRLRLNDVQLRDCSFSYDVASVPPRDDAFDPNHIHVSDLSIDVFAPVISNDNYRVWLRHFSLRERSGFVLSDLTARAAISDDSISIDRLRVELPSSLLMFGNITVPIDGIKSIGDVASTRPVHITVNNGSHIMLHDLSAFAPILGRLDYNLDIVMDVTGTRQSVTLDRLDITDPTGILSASVSGALDDLTSGAPRLSDVRFDVLSRHAVFADVLAHMPWRLSPSAAQVINALGDARMSGRVDGSADDATLDADISSDIGDIVLQATARRQGTSRAYAVGGSADIDSVRVDRLLPHLGIGCVTARVDVDGVLGAGAYDGEIDAKVSRLDYRGYAYRDISARATMGRDDIQATLLSQDPNAQIGLTCALSYADGRYDLTADATIAHLRPDTLHLLDKYPGCHLAADISIDGRYGPNEEVDGMVTVSGLRYVDDSDHGIHIQSLAIDADHRSVDPHIHIASDFLNGELNGPFRFSTLSRAGVSIVRSVFPMLYPDTEADDFVDLYGNDFAYTFTLTNTGQFSDFLSLPVAIVQRAVISGWMSEDDNSMSISVDAPWLRRGGDYIQNTYLDAKLYGDEGVARLYATTLMPTQKGDMAVEININGVGGRLDTDIDWRIIRAIPIDGRVAFSTMLTRDHDDVLTTRVDFTPGSIHFGNETWNIQPSTITYRRNRLHVSDFAMNTLTQSIRVNGVAGDAETDRLTVDLQNIELINIFETLEIDKAMISGRATGHVMADGVFGSSPVIVSDDLEVKGIGYNYCTIGDADVRLELLDGGKLFTFAADIVDDDMRQSELQGSIRIPDEYLEMNIEANTVPVGFLQPFMSAFTSSVSGYASGNAHLFGTFKDMDLEGDVYAHDLRLKIDFTNTTYMASDSVHIRPGIIRLDDVTLYDESMHTARLNGWVKHEFFHDASFDFVVSDADNFLSYDVPPSMSDLWYGRIYGNGSATIKGEPGVVDIGANMSTAPNSTFTFVLSDQLEAAEYSFITFRDMTPPDTTTVEVASDIPEEVELARRRQSGEVDKPTAYNMDLNVDIRPDATVVLIMDPIGGDSIRCNGDGHMRMTYGSVNNDLKLYGIYTLDKGNYNFTLQDIIIKDFIITKGSSIKFNGDPYAAQLNIKAYYQVNANLSDLDESFLQDRELNRTNVPVRAMMYVTGDMRQPDIAFDLALPTLTDDVYRKVKSIVSTEEMMNRQIIYLLALNRFYTPEYMASTTKGNELFAVASSTISSQLSSMLGKLSENWSISPNLRSDRGDFSDVEVDVSLSSSLLNNRLLFNGNFGYRDKSMNANQFIGDFDIEYKLDKSGNWRIKGYNRYNDQNYYLRTAQTTQGVGLMYNRDFDQSFRFLNKLFHRRQPDSTPADTLPHQLPVPVDTVGLKPE